MDCLLHPAIEGEANDPPAAPAEGETWLVGNAPTGDWSGLEGQMACFEAGAWLFVEPRDGLRVLDLSSGQSRFYLGGWQEAAAVVSPTGGSVIDAEARTAIEGLITALIANGILPQA